MYGEKAGKRSWAALRKRMTSFVGRDAPGDGRFSERDVVLITYGDQVREDDKSTLQSLREFLVERVEESINSVHVLPFYPYTSDDGFSVVDYKAVNPDLGSWSDVRELGDNFRLMYDAVINHISSQSRWFQGYLAGEEPYRNYFIAVDPTVDLSAVVRPRTLPLLTPVDTTEGAKHVWTTFSADQIDLNFGCPELLLDVLDVLLYYVEQGARLIRLDAIAFMWKEIGTSCIHLPQTHAVIQLIRAVLDLTVPEALLVTETNVPHTENISYFGNGANEAQMVYNFTLPPLTLYAFQTGDTSKLREWAATLETPSDQTTYFNFMASHDGVGLRPLEGILDSEQVQAMAKRVEEHGGLVSYKTNSDGSQSPYELNITYFDALNNPEADESHELQVDRFIASQAILLSLAGVPGIYFHSLFGGHNWTAGVERTGRARTINRQKLQRAELEAQLDDPSTIRHQVFHRYKQLIDIRTMEQAFHPNAAQRILPTSPEVFGLLRGDGVNGSQVLCVHNVTAKNVTVSINIAPDELALDTHLVDLISPTCAFTLHNGQLQFELQPYGVTWLRSG